MKRECDSDKFPLGSKLPDFALKGVDGEVFDSSSFSPDRGILIVFSCNHCPYVKGTDALLVELAKEYQQKGVLFVAINSNDPVNYPEDSFENMKLKARELDLPYKYLYDETQEVARMFDAACTPECYLFNRDKVLVYHGAICDSPKDPTVERKVYLRKALDQLLKGEDVEPSYVHPMGCSIKWKL